MDLARRELLAARVASGTVRLEVGDRVYLAGRPTPAQAYAAQEVYQDVLRQGELMGLFDEESLLLHLGDNGLWDATRQRELGLLPGQIEEFKVRLYQAPFRASERAAVRAALAAAKLRLGELVCQRHAHDHLSAPGAAAVARARYLLGSCLRTPDGRPAFGADFWEEESSLLDEALAASALARLGEAEVRELARTEPWRSAWCARRGEAGLFGVPAAQYTDEQRALVNWSLLYENVGQHPECPADEVLGDDDLLDGWMAVQRRRRAGRGARADDLIGSDKIRGAQEVYLVAETPADAEKVMGLNDDDARATQRARFAHLSRKGEVNELDMPDTRRRLHMEAARLQADALRPGP